MSQRDGGPVGTSAVGHGGGRHGLIFRVGWGSTPPYSQRFLLHRKVYYFHGFDPASTARYRRIFSAASERLGVEISDLPEGDGWRATREGTVTDLNYLRYDGLVRDYQTYGMFGRLGRGLRALAGYAADGALGKLPLRTVLLASSPYAVAFTPVIATAAVSGMPMAHAIAVSVILFALTGVQLIHLKMILAADLFAYMRELARGDGPAAEAYEDRLHELSLQISADGDETLIVGHSLGGIAAIRAVAGLLDNLPAHGKLSLLTLGSVHGIVLAQRGPGRDRLADAIAAIMADPRVFWVDVNSPRDAFCVPLTDPRLLIGEKARPDMVSPLVISAQLARAPRIPGDRRTVFAAMRQHMGYLLAPPEGAGFYYADIATGSEVLENRFRDRGNSPKARMWRG